MLAGSASMFGRITNGAIGAFDRQKAAQDRASEPNSAKEGDFMTRTEVRGLVNRSIKGQTPAQPKQNMASEAQAGQKEALRTAKQESKRKFSDPSVRAIRAS